MGLSRLSERCRNCPNVATCTHKRMEAVAYMEDASKQIGVNAAQPTLVPHDYRNVKISADMNVTIDVEDLKKQIEQSIYKRAGLMFGA